MGESALAEYLADARPDVAPIVVARDAAQCVCTRRVFHLRANTWLCVLLIIVLLAGGCSGDAASEGRFTEAAPGGNPGLPAILTPIAQPRPTPDPDAIPTMSPETRTIFLRSGADRLDREMGEWMALIANPRLTELRKHLDRGDFVAACQVTLVDVSFMLLSLTSPIAGLEDLQPAHDAARRTLTTWQDLRETLQAFCRAPEAEGVATVIAGLDSVAASLQRFQSELKRLQQTTAEPTPTALVGMPNQSSGLIQADGESPEDFLARIAVAESAYWPRKALLVYSEVYDRRDLYRGVSMRPADAQRCWVHQEQSLIPCQGQDVQESLTAHRDASTPTVYFAIATSDTAEMLVLYDVHDPRDPGDTVDGYRVVLRHRDGRWHEESLQWTY